MVYAISPSGPLGELVDRLWISESEPIVGRERRLPTGRVEMLINIDEDRLSVGEEPSRHLFPGCLVVAQRRAGLGSTAPSSAMSLERG